MCIMYMILMGLTVVFACAMKNKVRWLHKAQQVETRGTDRFKGH